MKRSQQSVPGAYTGAGPTDDGFKPNSHPQGIGWKNKEGRNATTDQSRRGAGGLAPRPSNSSQPYLGSSSASAGTQASMARVSGAGSSPSSTSGPSGSFAPVQNNAMANLRSTPNPLPTGATPPAPRGGPPGLRAGGRNQNYPNGGRNTGVTGRGRGGELMKPRRKGLGAAFFGEYA